MRILIIAWTEPSLASEKGPISVKVRLRVIDLNKIGQSGNLWNVSRCVAMLWPRLFAKESFLVLILCFVGKHSVT